MLVVAEAAETSEAVQPELWQLCRTLTGCTGDQLNDVYAHVDVLDTRATLLGLQQTHWRLSNRRWRRALCATSCAACKRRA